MEQYTLEPMMNADGRWSVPCPKCQALVDAPTQQGLVEAVCDHMNAAHAARFFGDRYTGRDS